MIYEYVSVRVIFGSGIFWFGFNSGKIESGTNRIGFNTGMVRVGFGSSTFESLWFGSLWFGFELGRVVSGVGNFGLGYNSGFVRFTSGVRVQIGSSHFGCRFRYGSGSFGSGFGSRISGQFC